MNISEHDLELLEKYLDGELEQSEKRTISDRLDGEPQLFAALSELTRRRGIRRAALQTMEPSEANAQQLVWRIRGAMLDQQRSAAGTKFSFSQWRMARMGSAAAACVVLGFFAGRLGHGGSVASTPLSPGISANILQNNPVAQIKPVDNDSSKFVQVGNTAKYSVPITNEYGQVVAWQTFDNPEQAKSFTEDLQKTQTGHTAPASAGPTRLASHEEQVPF